jgi:amidophosphoribosyltransferase
MHPSYSSSNGVHSTDLSDRSGVQSGLPSEEGVFCDPADRFESGLHEECGVVGIYNCPEAAKLSYLSLYALQHRGQESAGIVATDGGPLRIRKHKGLVADVFSEQDFEFLSGHMAIGHVRYSTTGASRPENAQPLLANYHGGSMAVAHNGNLTNADELRRSIELAGAIFQTSTDSEILLHLIAHAKTSNFLEALQLTLLRIKGAYSLVVLRPDSLVAVRDPHGIRPLCLGRLDQGWVVASETCAFDILGATYERDIEPGEILVIDQDGLHSQKPFAQNHQAFCAFENIYFSRPDSLATRDRSIYQIRVELGHELCREHPVEADLVIGVPDSAIPCAIGYAREAGLPFELGLIRNHYIGRTFIEPKQQIRDFGAKIKYNAVRDVIEGKRVVVVDDSIVRGTTSRKIVKMIRAAGAREVHLRSSAPPLAHPCYYGVDIPSFEELVASHMSVEEINQMIGSDSLGYLSIEGLVRVMPAGVSYCLACFDGEYKAGRSENFSKTMLDQGRSC